MFFVQTSTLPPSMHHKLTKHGSFSKQNNQFPTKTHVELKDNSIAMQEVEFQSILSFSPDTVIFDSTTKKSSTVR
jgi:hypothetical protein